MYQRKEYSITKYQKNDVQALVNAASDAASLARSIWISAKSDVDYYKLEYLDPRERELYEEIAETEVVLTKLVNALRQKYRQCRYVREESDSNSRSNVDSYWSDSNADVEYSMTDEFRYAGEEYPVR